MATKINRYSEFQLQLQKDIVDLLRWKNLDTKTLAKQLHRPYHTVRTAMRTLVEDGSIVPLDYATRNVVYKLSRPEIANSRIMPTVMLNKKHYKLSELVDIKVERATDACEKIPTFIVQLLVIAEKLHNGNTAAAMSLPKLRANAQQRLDDIQNALEFYEQILNKPKFWDPELLKNFPEDTDWNQERFDKAYARVIAEQTNTSE